MRHMQQKNSKNCFRNNYETIESNVLSPSQFSHSDIIIENITNKFID